GVDDRSLQLLEHNTTRGTVVAQNGRSKLFATCRGLNIVYTTTFCGVHCVIAIYSQNQKMTLRPAHHRMHQGLMYRFNKIDSVFTGLGYLHAFNIQFALANTATQILQLKLGAGVLAFDYFNNFEADSGVNTARPGLFGIYV